MNLSELKKKIAAKIGNPLIGDKITKQPLEVTTSKVTPIQELILSKTKNEKEISFYHFVINFEGLLDEKNLFLAINKVVERHQALRLTFFQTEEGWQQKVLPFIAQDFPITDLSDLPFAEAQAESDVLLSKIAEIPLRVFSGELFRLQLIRINETFYRLIAVVSHLCCDYSSLGLLNRDVLTFYEKLTNRLNPETKPLSINYLDYSKWLEKKLNDNNIKEKIGFWSEYFKNASPLSLSESLKKDVEYSKDESAEHEFFDLSPTLKGKIEDLMRQHPYTFFMVCLAAFALLIAEASRKKSFVIGTPTSGRDRPELENLIGGFAGLVGIFIEINPDKTFLELLEVLRKNALNCFKYQDTPLKYLEESAPKVFEKEGKPLIDLVFALNIVQADNLKSTGLKVSMEMQDTHHAGADFSFFIYYGEKVVFSAEYRKNAFHSTTVKQLFQRYEQILSDCVLEPRKKIRFLINE